jgi:hypothetical protein
LSALSDLVGYQTRFFRTFPTSKYQFYGMTQSHSRLPFINKEQSCFKATLPRPFVLSGGVNVVIVIFGDFNRFTAKNCRSLENQS